VARTARVRLGDAGERFAERSLSEKGWEVVARKWHGGGGEVDLVALDGDILVFVEVKTRRGAGYGTVEHLAALRTLGPTPHHRRSFRPVQEVIDLGATRLDEFADVDAAAGAA
jgi:putative endonuclease